MAELVGDLGTGKAHARGIDAGPVASTAGLGAGAVRAEEFQDLRRVLERRRRALHAGSVAKKSPRGWMRRPDPPAGVNGASSGWMRSVMPVLLRAQCARQPRRSIP